MGGDITLSMDLHGKKAVVTGSSRGLGSAIARAFAEAGASVAITSRNIHSLDELAADLASCDGEVLPVELDVRKKESIESCGKQVIERFGTIDILVNNAGTNVRKKALDVTWEDWDLVLETNLKSVFFCSQAFVPGMLEQGWGRIINIGSATCIQAYPHINAYCASRGGVLQLTKSLAAEWGPKGVTVNVLAPGWFRTDQTRKLWENNVWMGEMKKRIPAGRIGEPEELGSAAVYLASEDSAYVNGSLFMIDGAFTTGGMMDTVPL